MDAFLDRLTGKKTTSATTAKERLKLVLINDRTDLTAETMDKMKDEILKVISRYIEIDPNTVLISMTQEGREQRLIADIPIKKAKNRRNG
jgi:cell division topological specificity factor